MPGPQQLLLRLRGQMHWRHSGKHKLLDQYAGHDDKNNDRGTAHNDSNKFILNATRNYNADIHHDAARNHNKDIRRDAARNHNKDICHDSARNHHNNIHHDAARNYNRHIRNDSARDDNSDVYYDAAGNDRKHIRHESARNDNNGIHHDAACNGNKCNHQFAASNDRRHIRHTAARYNRKSIDHDVPSSCQNINHHKCYIVPSNRTDIINILVGASALAVSGQQFQHVAASRQWNRLTPINHRGVQHTTCQRIRHYDVNKKATQTLVEQLRQRLCGFRHE